MVGSLLRQLLRALSDFVVFQTRRAFGPRASAKAETEPKAPARLADPGTAAIFEPRGGHEWQVLGNTDAQLYSGGPPTSLLDLFTRAPTFVLDVGCSVGDFALQVKARFPESRVWGIEPNERAARIARSRLERVLSRGVDDIDWSSEGVARGEIDAVLLFDVLEHIYDPWKTLLSLRNLVSADAQLLVSIPNVRNALLIQDLVAGHWRYRQAGLLDITHIRFFTQDDMVRMFYQTGFRVLTRGSIRCPLADKIFDRHRGGPFPRLVELESASIKVHSLEDLAGLCALQHVFTLQPATYDELSPDERRWIDAPHPPTAAYAAEHL